MSAGSASGPAPRLSVIAAARRTVELNEHILRGRAVPVDFDTVPRAKRQQLVRGLLHALHAGPAGVGLAAPMTGIGLRVVISTAGAEPLALFNPRIVETHGPEEESTEGNLSLPDLRATVLRPRGVTVEWQTVGTGQRRTANFEGWEARVLQHEIEILDGRLFIDHASSPPLGRWRSDDDRARRAVAAVFGIEQSVPAAEALGIALLPPALHDLDSVLTRTCEPVDVGRFGNGELRDLAQAMFRVLYQRRGVGLAGPQVGLGLRVVAFDSSEGPPLLLINPEVVDRDEREETAFEGCLSIPGWRGEVARSTAVKVRTTTVEGESVDLDLVGYPARIAQHEIDHLDGILYPQRMAADARLEATDPDMTADRLLADILRREAQESRQSANRANAGKSSAKRRAKRRR